jgi:hypothetical protein
MIPFSKGKPMFSALAWSFPKFSKPSVMRGLPPQHQMVFPVVLFPSFRHGA